MDSFYDFESENFEMRLPTSSELTEIKQMLLTGERNQILKSVENIKKFLNTEESVSEILRSDILEFLCDAVLPSDSAVACSLYQCIEIMANHIEFFIHNHSCFAIESLMRTLHFLMKDCTNFKGLHQCLNLLNLILQGYSTHGVTPDKRTVENLLQVLATLKNLPPSINNKYQTGAFIFNLIELKILKWSQEACDTVLDSLSTWFHLINEILESEHSMRENLILLCVMLCQSALRYLLTNENEFTFEINENTRSDIIKNIIDFLITVGAPYFDSVYHTQTPTHLESFYQTILYFYTEEVTPERNRLIHGLCETGFLQLTTKLLTNPGFSQEQKLRSFCLLVLFFMILYLAEDVFHFPEVWPSGRDDFRCEVQRGIAQLPADATEWLDILVSPDGSFSSKLAILLYLYFYCMTAKSQDMLQSLYPAVVRFVRYNHEINSSVLLLKVIWFVFVMCQLSVAQTSSFENEVEETDEMVSLLEAQEDLSLVYTHHPALLYWAFSAKVSTNIQTQTVHLWLRNKTPDCKELDELMRKSSDVRYAILDILQNGWGQELDSAFSSLKSLLLDSDTDDLATSIWFLLPQLLAKFTADFISVTNVDYIIELSSLKTPKYLDATKIIRIASLLPEVLLKSDLISVVPSLSLVFRLIQLGCQLDDNRVLWVFLRHDGFIQKIIEGLHTNVSDIIIISIKILVAFWKECLEVKSSETSKKIEISTETILKILNTNCDQVLHEGLNFLEEILQTRFRSPVFVIGFDEGFLEVLFLEIQNACVKTNPENSNRCWRCLKLLLPLADELVTNPLLHELVILNLSCLKTSQEMRDFLTVWIDHYNSKVTDPCFGRKIYGGYYTETMMRIGRELEGQNHEELLQKVLRFSCWNEEKPRMGET